MKKYVILILLFFLIGCAAPFEEVLPEEAFEFCGTSTYSTCISDADCVSDGCSGQVCRSASEESIITTCEWTECYDKEEFDVACGCVNGQCQWA
ncbi:MAG TPA: eight-cysteine-cluster domain-containing protein [Candidatus Nanoarchaeia archaeon]|nr:eight-cysteine-cluster domain-containing protein [Candidatus Nanoarchaeia archaeon]